MKFVASLAIDRLSEVTGVAAKFEPFWPVGVDRLVLLIAIPDGDDDSLMAYGVDPNERVALFRVGLPATKLGDFLKLVVDGRAIAARADGLTEVSLGDAPTIVIPDPSPPNQGPKLVHDLALRLAAASAASIELAVPPASSPALSLPGIGSKLAPVPARRRQRGRRRAS
jgi:hypothetical protein